MSYCDEIQDLYEGYAAGDPTEAYERVFSSIDFVLPPGNSLQERLWWHFVDAEIMGGLLDAYYAAEVLESVLPREEQKVLKKERCRLHALLTAQKREGPYRRNLRHFFTRKEEPPRAHAYTPTKEMSPLQGECPLFIVEPYRYPWKELLAPYREKELWLLFRNKTHFFQSLQFDALADFLLQEKHYWLILSEYPTAQLKKQGVRQGKRAFVAQDAYAEKLLPLLHELLTTEPKEQRKAADTLFIQGRKDAREAALRRYGPSRHWALTLRWEKEDWMLYHKQDPQVDLLPARPSLSQGETRRALGNSPLRIAHCVALLSDGQHAPSRRLRELLLRYDPQQFEVHLLLSEQLTLRREEYPLNLYLSPPTPVRAPQTLQALKNAGLSIAYAPLDVSFKQAAHWMAQELDRRKIDIALFHCNEPIHLMAAQECRVPLKVYMEHGELPYPHVFDAAIVSHQEEAERDPSFFANPVALDICSEWPAYRVTKKDLGVRASDVVLTTVSNHLARRLSVSFCESVAQILQRIPHAYYMPIGGLEEEEDHLFAFFEERGVLDRVVFLGYYPHPGHLMQAMDLYLNEFPVGSGLACLEALAASVPILSMCYPQGPLQGRHGAYYFGAEYAIHSLDPRDYVETACQLLLDSQKRLLWQEQARKQYAQRKDPALYAQRHQEILETLRYRG